MFGLGLHLSDFRLGVVEALPSGTCGLGTRALRIRPRRPGRYAVRRICAACERQRALFRYHGIVKWDRFHTLCLRCFRAQVNRSRQAGVTTTH